MFWPGKVTGLLALALATLARAADPAAGGQPPGFPVIDAFSEEQIGSAGNAYSAVQDSDGVLHFGSQSILSFDGDRWSTSPSPGDAAVYGIDLAPDGRLWAAVYRDLGWFERRPDRSWGFHSLTDKLPVEPARRGPLLEVFADAVGATFIGTDAIYRWQAGGFQAWPMPGVRRLNGFKIGGTVYVHYRLEGIYRMTADGPSLCVPQSLIGADTAAVIWMEQQEGGWLLATGKGLVRIRGDYSEAFAPEVSRKLAELTITCGLRLPDGRYAFGTLRGGIVLMNADGTPGGTVTEADGLTTPHIRSLFADREGSLWVMSSSEVSRLSLAASSRIFDARANLRPVIYKSIARAGGQIYVASDGGIMTLDADGRKFIARAEGGAANGIVTIADSPVAYGYRGAWRLLEPNAPPVLSTIRDVFTAFPSRVHPGETLFAVFPEASVVSVNTSGDSRMLAEKLNSTVTSFAEDDRGNLWLGTIANGLLVAPRDPVTPSVPSAPSPETGLPALGGTVIVRSRADGAIAVFATQRAWFKRPGDRRFSAIQGYPPRPVLAVSDFLPDGSVWLAQAGSAAGGRCLGRVSVDPGGIATWAAHSIAGLEKLGDPRSILAESGAGGGTVLWIGGARGVLRHAVDGGPSAPRPSRPILNAFVRSTAESGKLPVSGVLPYSTRSVIFEFALPQFSRRAQIRLETRIDGIDTGWVPANRDSRRELTAVREGSYTFRVRAVAETGMAGESALFAFVVAPPWWRTPRALALACVVLLSLVYIAHRLRVRALHRRTNLLEEKVRERTEELAEASAAKTLFVANMSHDIRNPLNGIVGLAIALEDTRLDTRQREIVATLRECTTYLSSMVDDVLDFASIEAGRVELRPGPFVPAELLNSVVTTLRTESAQRGALLTIETDPDVPPVLQGDAGRIQQILVNYVSNALKYAGGHIRLTAAVPARDEIEFSVIDEGPGIGESEQGALFTKFSRLKTARHSHIEGTGLGLASCRLLADIMGGAVGVESRPGRGARFFLRLPLTIATEVPTATIDVTLPQATVLLVEDTDYNAMAATAVLGRLGLACERARTGEEAVAMFQARRHNIVLLDRNLPDMDGTKVAQRIRQLEVDGLRAVVLAVTAYCSDEDRTLCLQSGMDAFVGKPLTPEKLRHVLIDVGSRLLGTAAIDAPAEAPRQAVDTTLLEYLSDPAEGGLATQAERFLAALSESHDALLRAQRAGASGNDVGDAAHRVLGHLRMVGAGAAAEILIQIEAAARREDRIAVEETLPALDAEIEGIKAALRHPRGARKA